MGAQACSTNHHASMNKRLSKEIEELWQKTLQGDGLALAPVSSGNPFNSHAFVALLAGPPDSPYSGGVFQIDVKVPEGFPLQPPKMAFLTRVFHPNVSDSGPPYSICLDT